MNIFYVARERQKTVTVRGYFPSSNEVFLSP